MSNERNQINNPRNFGGLFEQHNRYRHHLTQLMQISTGKNSLNNTKPQSMEYRHWNTGSRMNLDKKRRSKQDMFKDREIQAQNDSLVLKILEIRAGKGKGRLSSSIGVTMADRGGRKAYRPRSSRSARGESSHKFDNSILAAKGNGERQPSARSDRSRRSTSLQRPRPSRQFELEEMRRSHKKLAFNNLIVDKIAREGSPNIVSAANALRPSTQ